MIYETDEDGKGLQLHVFSQEMHFVMEYMSGGELYKRLSSQKRYSEEGLGGRSFGNSLEKGL